MSAAEVVPGRLVWYANAMWLDLDSIVLSSAATWPAGSLLPFTSREDMDFFSHLEMHLRQEHPPLSGRDHMSYRSSYFPVKDVIDGDLCEQYTQV